MEAVSLAEAKLFLRVDRDDEDAVIAAFIEKAQETVEREVRVSIKSTSPAPLRLAILMLCLRAYESGETDMPLTRVEPWISPYRIAPTQPQSSGDDR